MKKIISLVLCLIISISAFSTVGAVDFTDVKSTDWFYDDVMDAVELGLVNGTSDTTYSPNDNLTIAEAVKLAAVIHELSMTGEITLESGSPWYQPYVDYAEENDILAQGLEYGDWDDSINRRTFMDLFSRALSDEDMQEINIVEDTSIPDLTEGSFGYNGIYKLYRAGIVQGSDAERNVKPDENIERSEVAAIVNRMMNEEKRVLFTLENEETLAKKLYSIQYLGSTENYLDLPLEEYLSTSDLNNLEVLLYEGSDYFLIKPHHDDTLITVNMAEVLDSGEIMAVHPIFTTFEGANLLMRANVSHIQPNTVVEIQSSAGISTFSPMVNSVDYGVVMSPEGQELMPITVDISDSPMTIDTEYFSVEIPEFWDGKFTYSEQYGELTLYSGELYSLSLANIYVTYNLDESHILLETYEDVYSNTNYLVADVFMPDEMDEDYIELYKSLQRVFLSAKVNESAYGDLTQHDTTAIQTIINEVGADFIGEDMLESYGDEVEIDGMMADVVFLKSFDGESFDIILHFAVTEDDTVYMYDFATSEWVTFGTPVG